MDKSLKLFFDVAPSDKVIHPKKLHVVKIEPSVSSDIQKTILDAHALPVIQNGFEATEDEIENTLTALKNLSEDHAFWQSLTEKQKTAFEKYRLSLMSAMCEHLQNEYHVPLLVEEKPKQGISTLLWVVFSLFMTLELAPMLWSGYLGIVELLSLIPWVPVAVLSVSSLVLCAVEAFLFYAVMAPLLKDALGITFQEVSTPRMEVYAEQLRLSQNFNKLMTSENQMHAKDYERYSRIYRLFSEHMVDVRENKIVPFKESVVKKCVRYMLSGLSTLLNLAGGYFFGLSLLAGSVTTAALIGTPLGWGIIGLVMLGQIGLRLAVKSNAMVYLLNPGAEKHVKIQEEMHQFQPQTVKHEEILAEKRQNEIARSLLNNYQLNNYQLKEDLKKNPHVDNFYRGTQTARKEHSFFKKEELNDNVFITDPTLDSDLEKLRTHC